MISIYNIYDTIVLYIKITIWERVRYLFMKKNIIIMIAIMGVIILSVTSIQSHNKKEAITEASTINETVNTSYSDESDVQPYEQYVAGFCY